MAVYPGVYRAKASSVSSNSIVAFIPQVFGEASVTITEFVGGLPASSELGWVSFHSGHPEHPVWLSGGGGDPVWVGSSAPPSPSTELWWDTDESVVGQTEWTKTINDDAAFYLQFTAESRGLLALSGNIASSGNALLMFRTGASAQCSLMASVGATVTCAVGAALTGTTGTDGHLTIRTNTSNNRLYIENRTGAQRAYAGAFLAMTAMGGPFTVS